jgi:hypothetical protein
MQYIITDKVYRVPKARPEYLRTEKIGSIMWNSEGVKAIILTSMSVVLKQIKVKRAYFLTFYIY